MSNVKLSQMYYGPFRVLERIGEAIYKLELPFSSFLHPVFHVTVLNNVGDPRQIMEQLPSFDDKGKTLLKPGETLCYMQKKGVALISLSNKFWCIGRGHRQKKLLGEDYDEMVEKFLKLFLEDKESLEGWGILRPPPGGAHGSGSEPLRQPKFTILDRTRADALRRSSSKSLSGASS